MARDEAEAAQDARIDRLKDALDVLSHMVSTMKVAAIVYPEDAARIGHDLAAVHRALGATTQAAEALHPTADLAVGVWRLLAEDRGEV